MDHPGINERQFVLYMGEKWYKEFNQELLEATERVMKVPYKTTITLIPTLQCESGYSFHFKGELKIVPQRIVCFYSETLLQAIQSFNIDECTKFSIDYQIY